MTDAAPLDVRAKGDGSTLRVKTRPSAPRGRVVGVRNGALRIDADAPPENGAANEAVVRVVARALGLPKSAVTILAGAASREKTLFVSGIKPLEVAALLQKAAEDRSARP